MGHTRNLTFAVLALAVASASPAEEQEPAVAEAVSTKADIEAIRDWVDAYVAAINAADGMLGWRSSPMSCSNGL